LDSKDARQIGHQIQNSEFARNAMILRLFFDFLIAVFHFEIIHLVWPVTQIDSKVAGDGRCPTAPSAKLKPGSAGDLVMPESCYNCGAPATSSEHAPPECFFPDGYRSGLLAVPSCAEHNEGLATDVEYVRNVICGHRDTNLIAARVFETAKDSYDHSPLLFTRTFSDVQAVSVDGEETGTFTVDLPRFKKVVKSVAYAMYCHDFGKRHDGDFDVFSTSLNSKSNLYRGVPDGYERLRGILEATAFRSMAVPQPKVFKYGLSRPGDGQIQYRFEFYEGFVVYALSLRHRLSRSIYLPVTSDLTVFRLGRD
jgi:hypothetical protein